MPDFTFNTTPSIRQTAGGAARLGALLKSLPFAATAKQVLFVTDPGIVKLGLCDAALQSIKDNGFDVTVFDAVEPDPKATTVLGGVEIAKAGNIACVVDFGGGSSMDVAKVVLSRLRAGLLLHLGCISFKCQALPDSTCLHV